MADIDWTEDLVTIHFPKRLLMSSHTLGFPRNLALRRLNKSFSKPLNISHSLLYPSKYLDYAYTVNQVTLCKNLITAKLERLFFHRHDPLIPSPHYPPLNPDRGPQNIASYIIGH